MRELWPQIRHRARLIRRTLALIWRAAGGWTVGWATLLVIQGLIPAALVALTKWVVDAVAAAVGAGISSETIVTVAVPAGLMAGIMLLQRVVGSIQRWVSTGQSELVADYVKGLVHERSAAADYAFFESSHYHDQLEQVNTQAAGRTLQLLQSVGGLLQSTVTFTSIGLILLAYSAWLPLVLVVGTFPAFLVVLRHNRKFHAWWERATPKRRLAQYYDLLLTVDHAAAEVRINSLGDRFRTEYRALRKWLREGQLDLIKRQAIANFGAAMLGLVVTGLTLAWIGMRALRGEATLGDLALFYQAFNQGQSLVGALFQNAGSLYAQTLFLEHLFAFLEQEDDIEEDPNPVPFPATLREGVRFDDVTFTYPGSERPALEGFSLEIPAGKTVAIVGENGAGKSTFIKLLCRFYDPSDGRVTVDGVDLRRFGLADLRRHVSVMFQTPLKYQMTARENIGLGDLTAEHADHQVVGAARAAGADTFLEKLPKGYDTLLGRWFDSGSELSGGEWQRVALARAFLRRSPLIVLDEPTSFMDSWAEVEWLRRFREMVHDQTALIITHRFTTAMQADIIHVVENGQIVESGTHSELVALGGRYSASWSAQMRQAGGDGQSAPANALPPA